VVLYPSIKAYYLVSRAYINIQTESNEDTGKYRVGGAIIVQLFHGYGAPKELYLYGNMGSLKKKIVKLYADDHSKSYWMVPSEYFVNRFPVVCETDPMKMFVTGQPRTDVLLRKMEVPYLENYIKDHAGKKFILYTPTHRNYAQDNNIAFTRLEWDRLNDFMKEEGFYLFFKPHPLELFKYRDGFRQYSNIVLVADNLKDYDISEYMHYFDLLISDYSSISSDFLIFNRPIIHFMYDRDSYVTNSCNLDALDAFCAGPICNSFEELFHNIKLSLTLPDFYLERREVAKKNALKYCDANNCLRVYETIVNKII
jgi:CDP-glycerol glycerophosphotransferase